MAEDTKEIYDRSASFWARREPNSLSDFTARPKIFDMCGDVSGLSIVDLGCGEGYCARVLEDRGASRIEAIELSDKMIDLGRKQQNEGSRINYRQGDVTNLPYEDGEFDMAVGVFVYNYLTVEEMKHSFEHVYRVLKDEGVFIFSVPHPSFPHIKSSHSPPFYFDVQGAGYFSSRNRSFNGEIYCRDGSALPVQMVPKTLEDYFTALSDAGFRSIPQVRELKVTDEMLKLDKGFFEGVKDIPLHLAFRLSK